MALASLFMADGSSWCYASRKYTYTSPETCHRPLDQSFCPLRRTCSARPRVGSRLMACERFEPLETFIEIFHLMAASYTGGMKGEQNGYNWVITIFSTRTFPFPMCARFNSGRKGTGTGIQNF